MTYLSIWLAGALSGGLFIGGVWVDYDYKTDSFARTNETFYMVVALILIIHYVLFFLLQFMGG